MIIIILEYSFLLLKFQISSLSKFGREISSIPFPLCHSQSRLLIVDAPFFDKMTQWQKKPNNMKNVEKESSKVKTIRPEWQEQWSTSPQNNK